MKKIFVPTDFSVASRNACEYAASLASYLNAEVQLLHVHKEILPATVGPEPWMITPGKKLIEKERLLDKELEYLKSNYPVEVKGELETGSTCKSIRTFSEKIDADLIILGVHKIKKHKILGSTVLTILQKVKVPVLLIPEGVTFKPIKSMVVAVDFTEAIEGTVFDALHEIYKKFDAWVRVVHVDKKASDLKASEVSQKLRLGVALSRFDYQYEKLESDDVEEGIEKFVDSHPTDLLVLVEHHHTMYEKMFEKIHTKSLSSRINLPLLILKPNSLHASNRSLK